MTDRFENDPARNDELILVDGLDRQIGTASKERAHCEGLLHRAFSVVLTRQRKQQNPCEQDSSSSEASNLEILLSQRAEGKYHCAGLWANSCCSHPRAGEVLPEAAYRRVREELGAEAKDLKEIGAFVYRAEFENGLCEYEYDHVLIGEFSGTLNPDPSEVGDVRWASINQVARDLAERSELFAPWAFTVLSLVIAELSSENVSA